MGNCKDSPNILNQVDSDQSQSHLMAHWKNLPSDHKRRTFEQQLNKLNAHQATNIYKRYSRASTRSASLASSTESDRICGLVEYRALPEDKLVTLEKITSQKQQLDQIGREAIANGEGIAFLYPQLLFLSWRVRIILNLILIFLSASMIQAWIQLARFSIS